MVFMLLDLVFPSLCLFLICKATFTLLCVEFLQMFCGVTADIYILLDMYRVGLAGLILDG